MSARYFPDIFDVATVEDAKRIILTDEGAGADTASRWALETPYVLELVSRAITLDRDSVVVDYGCGIGRIGKAMIEASACTVIGIDISRSMRELAVDYVQSERFIAMSPSQFDALVAAGLRADAAVAIWVLQHCLQPGDDIARIASGLKPDAAAFVLNMPKRAVPAVWDGQPSNGGFFWHSDQNDVAGLLRTAFHVDAEGSPDPASTPNMADAGAFWMALRKLPLARGPEGEAV